MSEFIATCPKCNKTILCDTQYVGSRIACPICLQEIAMPKPPTPGHAAPAAQPQPQPQSASATTSGKPAAGGRGILIGAIAAVVIVAIGAVIFLKAGGHQTALASTSPSTSKPAAAAAVAPEKAAPTPGPVELLPFNLPATASSCQWSNTPGYANDGDSTTRWAAKGAYYPSWWRVDLQSNYLLTKVEIDWFMAESRSFQYKIDTSMDDKNYVTAVDKTDNTMLDNSTNTLSTVCRYVRITVTGSNFTNGYPSFYECSLYGSRFR